MSEPFAAMDPLKVADVYRRLDDIRVCHGVVIPLAIESGSRAWGFPSPDSDYDCRFIFLRSKRDYLSPWERRDVIETPLVDEMDVNGWDLAKALKLLLKGNAVVIEWLTSPVTYSEDADFRARFLALANSVAERGLIARHYLYLGQRQRRELYSDDRTIRLKKVFYALRPAVALRWLRLHPEAALAPMHFPQLMAESDIPADVAAIVDDLIAKKAVTRELGSGHLPEAVAHFIDSEFEGAPAAFPDTGRDDEREARTAAEDFFFWAVERLVPA